MPYNLFTLCRGDSLARVPLTRDAQNTLTVMMTKQVGELLNEERERHAYEPFFTPSDGGIVVLEWALPDALSRLVPAIPNDVPIVERGSITERPPHAVVAVDPEAGRFCFQSLDKRNILTPLRGVLLFGRRACEVTDSPGLVLGTKLDAVHEGGSLFFTSETVVRRFLNLDTVFAAATDEEVKTLFAAKVFDGVDEATLIENSDRWVRRKVSVIRESRVLTTIPLSRFQREAKRCGVPLQVRKQKIVVPAVKADFKTMLKFFSEDFLDSPFREKVYEVSSKKPKNNRRRNR